MGSDLSNYKGEILYMFSKHVGIKEANEVKVIAILEAFRIVSFFFWFVIGAE